MAITVEMRTEISQLYVALFGRAPDGEGLGFWVGLRDGGMSLTDIANAMYATDPARDYYPLFLTNEEIIASFYVNVLGRVADAEGLAFWTAKLNAAGATPGSVITEMIDVVANYAGVDPDGLVSQALFNNKVEVAQYYGEANGNIDDAATVLATITDDAATVAAAIAAIDAGTIGTDGIDVTLTTGQDSVEGTPASDVVHGTFGTGAGDTYTAGDSIDLGLGTVDQLELVATGGTASAAIVVKNTETINIQDTVGGTFNALLVENAPAINFFNTLATQTSTVTNASQSSVYGLQGAGDLTVNFASTTGSADTAMVSLNGVTGSTVNVSDSDTVEKVTVATAGTNTVTLVGGAAAASLTVTGTGTNTFTLSGAGALAAVATIDASASTGANTFALGGNFNTGTVVKGGTGADTVSASLTTATLTAPTLTGVETLSTTWTANAILDLAAATGLTSLSINDKAAATGTVTVQNAQASLATVTVSNVAGTAVDSALNLGYGAATKGDMTLKIGSTSGTATAVNLGAVTISNSNSLNVTTLGALAHDFDNITVKGNQTSLGITVAAGGDLTPGDIFATGNIGALNVTTAAGSYFSGQVDQTGGKTIGDVTINATGTGSELDLRISGGTESIGNIVFNVTGNDISGYVSATTSGGGIGDITATITGDDNDVSLNFSAGYFSGTEGDGIAQGDVGNVVITVTGDDNSVSGGVDVLHGDLGDVTVSVTGDGNGFHFSGSATQLYYWNGVTGAGSGYIFVGGGNIGNVNLTVDGDSSAGVDLYASGGGSVGDVTVVLTNDAIGTLTVETDGGVAWIHDEPMTAGNIGNFSLTMNDAQSFSGSFSADGGDIGNISVAITGDSASGLFHAYATQASGGYGWETGDSDDYFKGGNVGDVTFSMDGASEFGLTAVASGGSVGTSTISMANGASGWYYLSAQMVGSGSPGGDTGAVNVTIGDDSSFWFGFNVDGALGALTVTAGDDVYFEVSGGGGNGGSTTGSPASTGATSLTFGNNADVWFHVGSGGIGGFSGSIGAITGTFGNGGSDSYGFMDIDGNVGAITLTEGSNADTWISYDGITGSVGAVNYTGGAGSTFYLSGGAGTSMGKVTLTGGDSAASAGIWVNGATSHAGVDASAWLGSLGVSLAAVGPTGTTIRVGAGGSWVQGTEGADNIFLGAGSDQVVFDTTPTAADVIFTFTVGATKDVLELVNAATVLEAVITADAASNGSSGDILRLVDITGGQDITTAAGLATALEAGGEYASVTQDASAAFTIITASSSTAATFYVFNVVDANADQVFDAAEVVLIGQVNASAAGAIGGLVLGNFA